MSYTLLATTAAAGLVLTALTAPASAIGTTDPGTGGPVRADLVGSVPSDPLVHGTAPGLLPWKMHRSSSIKLFSDGRLGIKVKGLVFTAGPFVGTAGPVAGISASVFCGDSASAAVATTAVAPLSVEGDGRIDAVVAVPESCPDPVVLVHPNSATSFYIASAQG
jgi:hypothetical protein